MADDSLQLHPQLLAISAGDDAESSLREIRRRSKAASRARLLSQINLLHRHIHKPLADIVRDNALHYLPVRSLLAFRSVCNSWSSIISSPFFAHRQSSAHRTISGLFLPSPSPLFRPFIPSSAHSLPDPHLSFLPYHHTSILSSCNGLLLLSQHNIRRVFIVCNPATRQFAELPEPPVNRTEDTAAVLVYNTGVFNFRPDYLVVVPFRLDEFGSFYGFQVFSSSAGTWWVSNEVAMVEKFIAGSGVAAGGFAYWMTTMQTVVGYDPAKDSVRVVTWPMNYEVDVDWRIGSACDDELFCTAVTVKSLHIFKLSEQFDGWLPVSEGKFMRQDDGKEEDKGKGFRIVEFRDDGSFVLRARLTPLWFQSGEFEFLFGVCGFVMGLDLAKKRVRRLEMENPVLNGDFGRCFSHISTLAAVTPLDIVDDKGFTVKEEVDEKMKGKSSGDD